MNQDPNKYYSSQQITYPSYPPQQPGFYGAFPSQSITYSQTSSSF
ncbi:unnamed protein product, partial [Rotaria magnacalcarata]